MLGPSLIGFVLEFIYDMDPAEFLILPIFLKKNGGPLHISVKYFKTQSHLARGDSVCLTVDV